MLREEIVLVRAQSSKNGVEACVASLFLPAIP